MPTSTGTVIAASALVAVCDGVAVIDGGRRLGRFGFGLVGRRALLVAGGKGERRSGDGEQ